MLSAVQTPLQCYHCGEICRNDRIRLADHIFCCEGCRMVYGILEKSDLCEYYNLNQAPGATQNKRLYEDKFAFLDDEQIAARLIHFKDTERTHVGFYLPQIHCSSCLYVLEHLHKLNPAIHQSRIHFTKKEIEIVFDHHAFSLRELAELLTRIGYEPHISMQDLSKERPGLDKKMIYRIGVAGFCFGNMMLLSFPEYLGIDASDRMLQMMFRILNVVLSIPLLLFSAQPFFFQAWKGIRQRFLNIDAPVALAISVTFIRSLVEVFSGAGGGYFDSMAGIIFFMLAGRLLQDRTYRQLSFDRDYTAYFPIAVTVKKGEQKLPTTLPEIRPDDCLLIHAGELIPADGILTRGQACIDYSFVTGESQPVTKEIGEIIYAGGRQTGGTIELLVIKEVAQSYLTSLWNREEFSKEKNDDQSFVHRLSRNFTILVLLLATAAGSYWWMHDSTRIWPAVTAVLIIACPCALLLAHTFTNGNMLRLLSRKHFYLRSAHTIETLANIDHIVFDKTGTLTPSGQQELHYQGESLTDWEQTAIATLAAESTHPLSRAIAEWYLVPAPPPVSGLNETAGKGLAGIVGETFVRLGSSQFITGIPSEIIGTTVYVEIDGRCKGRFQFGNSYRDTVPDMIAALNGRFQLSVLSGDNDAEAGNLRTIFGQRANLLFNQQPEEKLNYILSLQQSGANVMMIGDGLNDAGALKTADAGIAIAEQSNHFTPASDGILEAKSLSLLPAFLRFCRSNRAIITFSFAISILYNLIGLAFAVQGTLSPLICAILMPASSLSILLITYGSSSLLARWLHLT